MSSHPTNPARTLNDSRQDAELFFVFTQLDFISNITAFTDICLSPSLKEIHGFLNRPATINIVHELFPVFSYSKTITYQDVLYPSPWYWSDQVSWKEKKNKFYWRGKTIGGYSKGGTWRRHHRQSFVSRINAVDTTKVMKDVSASAAGTEWVVEEVPRTDYKELINVKLTQVTLCDPEDYNAQHQSFEVVKPSKEEAWQYKYLLDIDGNTFSGRFYALLKSMSLVFKIALFREWHLANSMGALHTPKFERGRACGEYTILQRGAR